MTTSLVMQRCSAVCGDVVANLPVLQLQFVSEQEEQEEQEATVAGLIPRSIRRTRISILRISASVLDWVVVMVVIKRRLLQQQPRED